MGPAQAETAKRSRSQALREQSRDDAAPVRRPDWLVEHMTEQLVERIDARLRPRPEPSVLHPPLGGKAIRHPVVRLTGTCRRVLTKRSVAAHPSEWPCRRGALGGQSAKATPAI
jgi:hypothetical protein